MTTIEPWGRPFADVSVFDQQEDPTYRRSWQPIDLEPVLSGTWEPPEPSVGRRSDGAGIFYPGKVHTVASETEGGKTWFALSVVLDEIAAGHHVVFLDFEDDEGGIVGRLLTLGANRDTIAGLFHYLRPDSPLGAGINLDDLNQLLGDTKPTLAVLDGVTEAMTAHGLDPLSNSDAAKFGRVLPRRLAAAGAASVSLDHVTKSAEGRGRYALGAVHKLNGLDGAAYVLESRRAFGIGITGRSTIKIAKDRPGQLRKNGLPSSGGMFWYGDLVLTSHAAQLLPGFEEFSEITVETPESRDADAAFRPTFLMGRVMAAIESHGPLTQRRIRAAVGGRGQAVTAALDLLILDGYLTESTPHTILKPYGDEAK